MELQQQFEQVMETAVNMALATSTGNMPNVRVVTFAWDPAQKDRVFFSTFKGNQKVKEFQENPDVACIMLPMGPESDAQVRLFGKVGKASIGLEELIGLIAKKFPGDADTIQDGGDMMDVYEVVFDRAYVTIGMTPPQELAI